MEVTVSELNNSSESFNKLLGLGSVPPNLKIRLARIASAMESELKNVNDQRLALFKKYGKQVEGKDEWTVEGITLEARKEFDADLHALMEERIPLPGEKIKAEFLANVSELNSLDLLRLSWLIDLEEDTASEPKKKKLAAVK